MLFSFIVMKDSRKHRGLAVKAAVKSSGMQIAKLAQRLGIGRTTLYNKFQNPELGLEFIKKVAEVIQYDVIEEFPFLRARLLRIESTQKKQQKERLKHIQAQYLLLKKKHETLLNFLKKGLYQKKGKSMKEAIKCFLKEKER